MREEPSGTTGRPATVKSKRSQTVSLVLLAGAAAAAFGLGHLDPSQEDEDVLVYAGSDACIAEHIRNDAECRSEYETARAAYPTAAPRYSDRTACESHHGPDHCVTGESVTEEARGRFLPRMAAYMIGRRAEQGFVPQPVFEHAPRDAGQAHSGGHGGYCTGSGARVFTASGGRGSSARVHSASVRSAAFGGFGQTGRAFSASSAHGPSGSG